MLNDDEKALFQDMCNIYVRCAAQTMSPDDITNLQDTIQIIVNKIIMKSVAPKSKNTKLTGITDEWWNNVCSACNNLTGGRCTDSVTAKFPGKCDPICHYERKKFIAAKK